MSQFKHEDVFFDKHLEDFVEYLLKEFCIIVQVYMNKVKKYLEFNLPQVNMNLGWKACQIGWDS